MHKTVNISIGNTAFIIHEEAYTELKAYLDAINAQFAKFEDREDIIADIEERIAELFLKEAPAGTVIDSSKVRKVMTVMGEPQSFGEDAPDTPAEVVHDGKPHGPKRLYRDGEEKIIAGVCAGLANYFGIDRTIVRVIFLVALISGALTAPAMIIYLVFWLAVPEAKTLSERMEMRGEPVTLEHIEETVRSTLKKGTETMEAQKSKAEDAGRKAVDALNRLFKAAGRIFWGIIAIFKRLLHVIGIIIGLALIAASVIGSAGAIFLLVILLLQPNSPLVDIPFDLITFGPEYIVFVVSGFFVGIVPLVVLAFIGRGLIRRKNIMRWNTGIGLFVLWIIALSLVVATGIKAVPEARESLNRSEDTTSSQIGKYVDIMKVVETEAFDEIRIGDSVNAEIRLGEEPSIQLEGARKDVEEVIVDVSGGQLTLRRDRYLVFCIFCLSRDVDAVITVTEWPKEMRLSGASTVVADGIELETMRLDASGASEANLSGTVQEMVISLSGASRADLSGSGSTLDMRLSGASKIDAFRFPVKNVQAMLSGSSKVEMSVTDILHADASGASKIFYKGDPEIVSDISGSSKLQKILSESFER